MMRGCDKVVCAFVFKLEERSLGYSFKLKGLGINFYQSSQSSSTGVNFRSTGCEIKNKIGHHHRQWPLSSSS